MRKISCEDINILRCKKYDEYTDAHNKIHTLGRGYAAEYPYQEEFEDDEDEDEGEKLYFSYVLVSGAMERPLPMDFWAEVRCILTGWGWNINSISISDDGSAYVTIYNEIYNVVRTVAFCNGKTYVCDGDQEAAEREIRETIEYGSHINRYGEVM